ncbi:hypothetical protein [Crocosphaera chwakensis]|uniref:Uncharacterized protein n=1 Tax=Crocosphaera chwakensis CCY0110 TaxID=391612 RepID=A3IH22_9CHRO|nr:hypothetical protein [Crocosphaera chwakensis]EAZ94264.1 hypothetical protein CY0110_10327 [Crocosphaera chwakensis CCY0110]
MPKDILKIIDVVLNKGILVAIPIVIGIVGNNISQSLDRAKLIDALLDDLTNTETRRDIALMALHMGIPVKKSILLKIDEDQSDEVVEIAEILLRDSIIVDDSYLYQF